MKQILLKSESISRGDAEIMSWALDKLADFVPQWNLWQF